MKCGWNIAEMLMAGGILLGLHAATRAEEHANAASSKDAPVMKAKQTSPTPQETNPLLDKWDTPFGMPPFDRIREDHYLPAFQAAIAGKRQEAEAVAANPEPATFANTVAALDAAGEALDRVEAVFGNLRSAETNDRLQEIARQVAPLTSALRDDILLNEQLFARIKAVWQQRDTLSPHPEQR